MDRQSIFHLLRWLVVSALLGAAVGFGIGLSNDKMEMTLPLGFGIGLILGLVLAVQNQSKD